MFVDLPSDLTEYVHDAVGRGVYASESDVIGVALRLLQERERSALALRRELQPALDELDGGGGMILDGDDELHRFFEGVIAQGNAHLEAERRRA